MYIGTNDGVIRIHPDFEFDDSYDPSQIGNILPVEEIQGVIDAGLTEGIVDYQY